MTARVLVVDDVAANVKLLEARLTALLRYSQHDSSGSPPLLETLVRFGDRR